VRLLSDELPDADLFAAVAEPEAAEVEATEPERRAVPPEQRETLERLAATFGADSSADDEERRAKHAARLIREASISCEGWRCEREFAAGDVIHRRRRQTDGGPFGPGWTLRSYCERCVSKWDPWWPEHRREPVECPGAAARS
jgi:hypothetical protein